MRGKGVWEVMKKVRVLKGKFEIWGVGWDVRGDVWGGNFEVREGK